MVAEEPRTPRHPATTILLLLLFMAGLILSVLSGLKVCSSICSKTATFTIFNLDFGWFGTAFFTLLILLLVFSKRIPQAGPLLSCLTFAALGAEVRLIWIQKHVIGSFCPVCLSIAGTIVTAALILSRLHCKAPRKSMRDMVVHLVVVLSALLIGFGSTLAGVEQGARGEEVDIYLGHRKSHTTVYFISDWVSPECLKVEPEIEKMYPKLATAVRLSFVDMPGHAESGNFTPYHLQFMAHEKGRYIQLRQILYQISRNSKNPSHDQIQTAVRPLGVSLRPPDFTEIMSGIGQWEAICQGFGITTTPTVVIYNSRTQKRKILAGSKWISSTMVQTAIAEVEQL